MIRGAAILFAAALASLPTVPAAAFVVDGALVDLTPGAEGGVLNLERQVPFLEAARRADDPPAALVDLMRRLPTEANRRAAFAWLTATSRTPERDGPLAIYALAAAGLDDPRFALHAALFAQSRGARAADLYEWAKAGGLAGEALGKLERLLGPRPGAWRFSLSTASAPAAAGGG